MKAGFIGKKAVYIVDTKLIFVVIKKDRPRQFLIFELAVIDTSDVTKLVIIILYSDKIIFVIYKK